MNWQRVDTRHDEPPAVHPTAVTFRDVTRGASRVFRLVSWLAGRRLALPFPDRPVVASSGLCRKARRSQLRGQLRIRDPDLGRPPPYSDFPLSLGLRPSERTGPHT
jgi:hypothetical protein